MRRTTFQGFKPVIHLASHPQTGLDDNREEVEMIFLVVLCVTQVGFHNVLGILVMVGKKNNNNRRKKICIIWAGQMDFYVFINDKRKHE